MPKMLSLDDYMQVLEQAQDSLDLDDWERKFVPDIVSRWKSRGRQTTWMSPRQVELVERIAQRFL